MKKITVGSVCSGIEAASVGLPKEFYEMKWFSEIADFPSRLLKESYPNIPNHGDMCDIPEKIVSSEADSTDLICGGTPCQAFSFAGWKEGLSDERGNLTLKFIDIIEKNDFVRKLNGKSSSFVLWENVEGVLRDKTNAFGSFISSLIGVETVLNFNKWNNAGFIHGPKRNVAWRVIDAKYFGLPQQRKRLFVLASDTKYFPENILFDYFPDTIPTYNNDNLSFVKNNHSFEVFRSYTDCLYTAYGTKWNGNAAAYNGSLFIAQNNRLRRITPLECERLMGFPDNYTNLEGAKRTNRYQALGNSWAIPVVRWIGDRLEGEIRTPRTSVLKECSHTQSTKLEITPSLSCYFPSIKIITKNNSDLFSPVINGTPIPQNPEIGDIKKIIDCNPEEKLYISPTGCMGIIRRKHERNVKINPRLEFHLKNISSTIPITEIEKISRIQPRGKDSYVSLKKLKKQK